MTPNRPSPGRPKGRLPPARRLITRRVRALVAEAHLGNLSEAARHTGLPYGTVRDLYLGRTTRPGLDTLVILAAAYDLTPTWFSDQASTERPGMALETSLPPDPEYRRGSEGRRLDIPLAAWPLARLILLFEGYLPTLPAAPDRPLIGAMNDPGRIRQALVVFLLRPLLEGQQYGYTRVLGADPPFRGTERPDEAQRAAWVTTLRALGSFWERALSDLIAAAEAAQ